jgi:hypothetical protein
MHLFISRVSWRRTNQLTNTLYGTTEDENWHALGNGADETAELEEEDGGEEDMFGFDDGEELTDEED